MARDLPINDSESADAEAVEALERALQAFDIAFSFCEAAER